MKLAWDQIGQKQYETGVDEGVLYPASGGAYPKGYAWNGLTAVKESPSGAEAKPIYADNQVYLNLTSAEKFGATIDAWMYPDEFAVLDGSAKPAQGVKIGQQARGSFGLSYRTILGNDTEGDAYGYIRHLIYGAQAAPTEKTHNTVNDAPEAGSMSWVLSTTPVSVAGFKPTATLDIDSTKVDPEKLVLLESILHGTELVDARLPLPDEIVAIIGDATPSALTLTILPADNTSAVAIGDSVVLTFNNKVSKESIVVASSEGDIIACTKTVDETGKIITFKPVTNLTAATKYLVTLAGVSDIYNQSLPVAVMSFTTA